MQCRAFIPNASARCSTMANDCGMNLPSTSSTGNCSNGNSVNSGRVFSSSISSGQVNSQVGSRSDRAIRIHTGLKCGPVLHLYAMILEGHAGSVEHEAQNLAAPAYAEVMKFVLWHCCNTERKWIQRVEGEIARSCSR